MRGAKAKVLRKTMGIKKPTVATGGYMWFDVIDWAWKYQNRRNLMMNVYRGIKRRYRRRQL